MLYALEYSSIGVIEWQKAGRRDQGAGRVHPASRGNICRAQIIQIGLLN